MEVNFSVIVPLFNKENTVSRSICSVLRQSYSLFELIVVDDGSTDSSAERVRSFQDSRVVFVQKENGGPSSARNIGIAQARNKWVVFLDADDELERDALQTFADMISDYPGGDVYAGNFYQSENGKRHLYSKRYGEGFLRNPYKSWFFHKLMPCAGTCVFDRQLLMDCPYDNSIRRYEDAEMMMRLVSGAKVFTFSQPVMCYDRDQSSASKRRTEISEDYLGHLSFESKTFWHKMLVYDFYVEAINIYPKEARFLYKRPALLLTIAHRICAEWRLLSIKKGS